MGRHLISAALALSIMAAGCTKAPEQAVPEPEENTQEQLYRPGVAVMKLSEGLSALIGEDLTDGKLVTRSSAVNDLVDRYGVTSFTRVFGDDGRWLERQRREGLHRWFYVEYDPSLAAATRAASDIAAIEGVEIAEPVRKVAGLAFYDDPYYGSQWHLRQSSGVDINVEEVWRNYTCGSRDVIVSVVDNGIDQEHPDLVANLIPGGSGLSHNFVSGGNVIKAGNHGTHVAGIIAAVSNNSTGVAGIAGGDAALGIPGVRLLSCQIFQDNADGTTTTGNIPDAIRYGADNGAVISQNSWGYVWDTDQDGKLSASEIEVARNSTIDSATKAAVDYFTKYAGCDNDGNQLPGSPMKGGIVIFAAGNDNIPYGAPSDYEPIVSVGSMASDGYKSSFSNYGDWVDICAPGSAIYSTIAGGYGTMSGTSMACPMVSGVAALVLSCRGGMNFTNAMLRECLIGGASGTRVKSTNIGPMVDALGAILYGKEEAPETVGSFGVSASSNSVTVSWAVPAKSDGKAAYGAMLCVGRDREAMAALDPLHPAAGIRTVTVQTSGNAVGETVSGTVTGLDFETEYHVTVVPFNYGPIYASVPEAVAVTTGANNAPVISSDVPVDGIRLKASQSYSINFSVSDPDGHQFSVQYTAGSAAERWTDLSGGKYLLRIDGAAVEDGEYSAQIVATDSYGAATVLPVDYVVLENRPPEVAAPIDDILLYMGDGTRAVDVTGAFVDPDGDNLSYELANTSSSCAHVVIGEGVLYVTPRATGTATVTVTAKDPRSASVSQTFRIAVREQGEVASVYPTQVTSVLYVATSEKEEDAAVRIVSSGGAVVHDGTVRASAFAPAEIDMGGIAPGQYSVSVSFAGQKISRNIVKL